MPKFGEVTGDELKAQLDEYHVLVAEVIGGLSADLTSQANRVAQLETQLAGMEEEIAGLKEANRLMIREIMNLRSAPQAGD